MHTEINYFSVSEGMHKEYKGGKRALKREHGCTSSPFDKNKTLVPKGNSDKKKSFLNYTYIKLHIGIYTHI